MSRLFAFISLFVALLGLAVPMRGAEVALRTNVLWWATTTPNLGFDVAVGPRFSVGASLGYNAFNFSNRTTADGRDANPKLHHWAVAAEGDYWFRHALRGAYAGVHVFGGEFNAGGLRFPAFLRRGRYEGYGVGAGVHGGYRWRFGHGWGLDLSLGMGYARLNYTDYECGTCGKSRGHHSRNYVGPTSASISIIYNLPTGGVQQPEQVIPVIPTDNPSSEMRDTAAVVFNAPVREVAAVSAAAPVLHTDTVRFVLRYGVDVHSLRPAFRGNHAVVERIGAFVDSVVATGGHIDEVRLTGYASPEYEAAHNLILSENRARSAGAVLVGQCGLAGVPMSIYGVGDDWQGLVAALSTDDVAVKNIVERRSSAAEAKARLKELEGGATLRRLLREVYPDLRRTEIVFFVTYNTAEK